MQPAAEFGADAETLPQASARIPEVLRHNDRAVASDDFTNLALETPGVQVGRAHVLPRHKPHERVDGVPGVVTLIVLPAYDPLQPDQPTPDKEMLRRVCAWLEPRRLVTTELYITPPQYVRLSCSVAVEPEAGAGEETLRRHVELGMKGPANRVEEAMARIEAEVSRRGYAWDAPAVVTSGPVA